MNKKTVKDIDLKGKKVLVRCDFNVPMNENQKITDNYLIYESLGHLFLLIIYISRTPIIISEITFPFYLIE